MCQLKPIMAKVQKYFLNVSFLKLVLDNMYNIQRMTHHIFRKNDILRQRPP